MWGCVRSGTRIASVAYNGQPCVCSARDSRLWTAGVNHFTDQTEGVRTATSHLTNPHRTAKCSRCPPTLLLKHFRAQVKKAKTCAVELNGVRVQ
eukprot:6481907-Amphidinium_carterae.1